jgi:hypothetical protein
MLLYYIIVYYNSIRDCDGLYNLPELENEVNNDNRHMEVNNDEPWCIIR